MENWTDVVVAIAALAIPVVFGFAFSKISDNQKALDLLKAIEPLAKDAVAMAEKLGVTDNLTGALKHSKAVEYVLNALTALGFKDTDLDVIKNAVEKAYMESQDKLHEVYSNK